MVMKLLFLVTSLILLVGNFINAKPPQICYGPAPYKTPSKHHIYVQQLERHGFINEKGQINKMIISDIFKINSTQPEKRQKIIQGYENCADQIINADSREEKYEAYLECLNSDENAGVLFQ